MSVKAKYNQEAFALKVSMINKPNITNLICSSASRYKKIIYQKSYIESLI